MGRMFRISGVAALAIACSLPLIPMSAPAVAGALTCVPSTVVVNPSGDGQTLGVSCTDANPGPTTNCSVTVTAATPPMTSAGGPVNVSASNCGTISGWVVNPQTSLGGITQTSFTDQLPNNPNTDGTSIRYTYTVSGTGSPASASGSILVPAASAPPPPTGSCGSLPTLAWVGSKWTNVNVSGTAVAQFTVPAGTSVSTGKIQFSITNANRSAAVSYALSSGCSPSSFPTAVDPTIGGYTLIGSTTSGAVYMKFQVGGSVTSSVATLQPGKTYYIYLKSSGNTVPVSFNFGD